jgi:hypothetical protein
MTTPFSAEGSADPAEQFLLATRRGWCVHFATAAVLMLRAAGVPARFVTGYVVPEGAAHSEILDRYGHAWAEAAVTTPSGRKWVTVDPSMRPAQGVSLRQRRLQAIIVLAALTAIVFTVVAQRTRVTTRDLRNAMLRSQGTGASDAERITAAYHRMSLFFHRLGFDRHPSVTPGEFVRTVPDAYRRDAAIITEAFERVRYMGFRLVGTPLTRDVDAAETRLLAVRSP